MKRLSILAALAITAGVAASLSHGGERSTTDREQPAAAPPPVFSPQVLDVFFTDARQALGPRPQPAPTLASPTQTPAGNAAPSAAKHNWSQIVSAEDLEDEVKLLAADVADLARSASTFKATGQKRLRSTFSVLAVTFGVIGQFDGNIRWQSEAPGMRDLCARAARNLKAASDATLREARSRGDDLASLVRGQGVTVPEAEVEVLFNEVVDRRGLMSRLEIAERDRLRPWLASQSEFNEHRDQVVHEAAMLRLLANIARSEGFEYADDEAFREHADDFDARCRELLEATHAGDYAKARTALTGVSQSCDRCHGDFRS
ncbi:MAG: cytochrome c [Pirellulales bacterium]|nr:cytochrome c [Pirellulales bacterium]